MEIWMNVVKYENLEACIEKNIVPFAVCISKSDKRNPKSDKFIDTYYGITMDNRGYAACICNVILADKCRNYDYKKIRTRDRKMRKIKEFKPNKSDSLDGKVIVDVYFEDGTKLNSIELVESVIENIEKGKKLINRE